MTFSYSSPYLSVPFSWVTWYCRGVSRFLSSCWEKTTLQFFLSLHDPGKRKDMGEGGFSAWILNNCFGWPLRHSLCSQLPVTRSVPNMQTYLNCSWLFLSVKEKRSSSRFRWLHWSTDNVLQPELLACESKNSLSNHETVVHPLSLQYLKILFLMNFKSITLFTVYV